MKKHPRMLSKGAEYARFHLDFSLKDPVTWGNGDACGYAFSRAAWERYPL